QIGRHGRQSIVLFVCQAVLEGHVLALDEAGLSQGLGKRGQSPCSILGQSAEENANHWQRPLLRARRERPRAKERDEIASLHGCTFHSITSLAATRISGGMVTPSAAAVLRLIAICRGGCSIGKSPARAPLKMRSTKEAARR